MYRRFDSTPGNTISIQGQVHVAVRRLLKMYSTDDAGKITSISVTGGARSSPFCNLHINIMAKTRHHAETRLSGVICCNTLQVHAGALQLQLAHGRTSADPYQ